MMMQIVGSFAEFERAMLRERTRSVRILMIVIKDSGDRDRPVGALRAGG